MACQLDRELFIRKTATNRDDFPWIIKILVQREYALEAFDRLAVIFCTNKTCNLLNRIALGERNRQFTAEESCRARKEYLPHWNASRWKFEI
jgi:hypothetical protein